MTDRRRGKKDASALNLLHPQQVHNSLRALSTRPTAYVLPLPTTRVVLPLLDTNTRFWLGLSIFADVVEVGVMVATLALVAIQVALILDAICFLTPIIFLVGFVDDDLL